MLTRFLKNARGGVAPLMAVVAVPLIGAVGMTVDYSRVTRAAFQVALDSTALMMSTTKTDAERQTEATKTFSALFNRLEVTEVTVTPVFHRAGGSKLNLNGTAVVHTNFLGVIGISQVDISAMSVSTWGNTRLRVALVLDDTGSMPNDGKMDALKIASHYLQSGRSERTGHHCRCAGSDHAILRSMQPKDPPT
jgi:Flp pilus assembly protein TadG